MRRLSVGVPALLLTAMTAAAGLPELEKAERALFSKSGLLAVFLPDGPERDEALRKVDRLLGSSGLKNATTTQTLRDPVERGPEGYVPVELSGEGGYLELDAFLAALPRLPRVITVARLDLSSAENGRLRYTAILRLHHWPQHAVVTSRPLSPRDEEAFKGAPEDRIEDFRRDESRYRAKVALLETLRGGQRRWLRLLSAFDGSPVVLTRMTVDGERLAVSGRRPVPGPHLREAVARAGARVVDLTSSPEGLCESFHLEADVAGSGDAWTADRTWMFGAADASCDLVRAVRVPRVASWKEDDGTSLSFELVRSAGGSRPDLLVATGAMTGRGAGYRILSDRKGRYFGYEVQAEPLADRRFRVSVGPLTVEARARLAKEYGELIGDPVAIEYPEPEVVASGEPLLLDLMVNPQTGETLRDLVRVTAPPPPSPLVRVVNGALNRNGRFVARTGTAWGRPALEIPDVGSFTLAFDRVDSGDCIAAKLRQDPTAAFEGVLSFEHGKDAYEWSSRDAIVVGRAAPAQLWLCRERAASPRKP